MKLKLFISGLALLTITGLVSAQNQRNGRGNGIGQCNRTGKDAAYVDNNNNGVCDNFENRTTAQKENGQGKSAGFVDGNKYRNCDNFQSRKPTRKGKRQGRGMGFVDVNKD